MITAEALKTQLIGLRVRLQIQEIERNACRECGCAYLCVRTCRAQTFPWGTR